MNIDWANYLKKKYGGKKLSVQEALILRNGLISRYGEKIIPEIGINLTDDEALARFEYEALSKHLYGSSFRIKQIDENQVKMLLIQDRWFHRLSNVLFLTFLGLSIAWAIFLIIYAKVNISNFMIEEWLMIILLIVGPVALTFILRTSYEYILGIPHPYWAIKIMFQQEAK